LRPTQPVGLDGVLCGGVLAVVEPERGHRGRDLLYGRGLGLFGVRHRCAFLVTGVDSTKVALPVRSGGRFTPISLCPHTPVKVALTDVCGASAAGSVRAGFRRCNGWLHTSWKRRVPGRDGGVPGAASPRVPPGRWWGVDRLSKHLGRPLQPQAGGVALHRGALSLALGTFEVLAVVVDLGHWDGDLAGPLALLLLLEVDLGRGIPVQGGPDP